MPDIRLVGEMLAAPLRIRQDRIETYDEHNVQWLRDVR
jgi:hypothetical protein